MVQESLSNGQFAISNKKKRKNPNGESNKKKDSFFLGKNAI